LPLDAWADVEIRGDMGAICFRMAEGVWRPVLRIFPTRAGIGPLHLPSLSSVADAAGVLVKIVSAAAVELRPRVCFNVEGMLHSTACSLPMQAPCDLCENDCRETDLPEADRLS